MTQNSEVTKRSAHNITYKKYIKKFIQLKVPKWNLPLTSNNIFVHLEFSPFPNLGEGVHFLWDPTGHHRSAVWRGWGAEGPPKDFVVGWRARSVPSCEPPCRGSFVQENLSSHCYLVSYDQVGKILAHEKTTRVIFFDGREFVPRVRSLG